MTAAAGKLPFPATLVCDCCREARPDASVRIGLHPVDDSHRRTQREFRGVLCDDCLGNSRKRGSKARRWLLKLLTRPGPRAARRKSPPAPSRPRTI